MTGLPEYFVYIFPYATLILLGWWFFGYAKAYSLTENRLSWVLKGPKKLLDFEKSGRLTKRDVLPMLLITLVAGTIAFLNLGKTTAPQTFYMVDRDGIVLEMEQEMKIVHVFYYTGGNHGDDDTIHYTLEFSTDGVNYRTQPNMLQEHSQTYQWRFAKLDDSQELTKYIRLSAVNKPLEMGELCIVAEVEDAKSLWLPVSFGDAGALFDERNIIPKNGNYLNGTHFDEIYHARAAREILIGREIYEITHPPLGKEIIAAGVQIFGMTPFGWRVMGALFGVLMLPLMYLLLKQLFDSTFVATCGTLIWAADFMRFTQTRIATIDTYNVFFVLLMFIFIHRWLTLPKEATLWQSLPVLFMCGLSFGLGAAAKWSSIYAGFGLVAIYVLNLYRRRENKGYVFGTLAVSLVFFIAVPAVVYALAYIPYVKGGFTLTGLWNAIKDNQIYMFNYHTGLVDTHSFSSTWYMWLVDARPINYYYSRSGETLSQIMAFNNPLLSWGGLVAMVFCAVDIFKQKSFKALFIVIAYLSVFLPWVAVSRLTFAYHYFPASMFLVLAICYVFWRFMESAPAFAKKRIVGFTAVTVLLFVMFYPLLSGAEVPYWYAKNFLKWLPSWAI